MIGDTGERYGTPASTECLSMALRAIIISTVLSERKISVHRISCLSICPTFIKMTSLAFATLAKAALMSISSALGMWTFLQAA